MGFNPRHVPWMTIIGVAGLVLGYFIGKETATDPMIPAFWGLAIGSGVALVLRTVLTIRWARQMKDKEDPGQGDPL